MCKVDFKHVILFYDHKTWGLLLLACLVFTDTLCGQEMQSKGAAADIAYLQTDDEVRFGIWGGGSQLGKKAPLEFEHISQKRLLPIMKLSNHIGKLAQKNIWMVIGDQDTRVSTAAALSLIGDLQAEKDHQASNTKTEFNLMHEPKGHTTPEGAVNRAVEWLSQISK